MTRDKKVKLLEIFNNPITDAREFSRRYRALAASMTGPIVKRIEAACPCKRVKVGRGKEIHPELGSVFLTNFDAKTYSSITSAYPLPKFSLAAAEYINLKDVTPEAVEQMIENTANHIIVQEKEAIEKLQTLTNTDVDDITLYVFKDFEAFDDPSFLRQQRMGLYGWEEINVVG